MASNPQQATVLTKGVAPCAVCSDWWSGESFGFKTQKTLDDMPHELESWLVHGEKLLSITQHGQVLLLQQGPDPNSD